MSSTQASYIISFEGILVQNFNLKGDDRQSSSQVVSYSPPRVVDRCWKDVSQNHGSRIVALRKKTFNRVRVRFGFLELGRRGCGTNVRLTLPMQKQDSSNIAISQYIPYTVFKESSIMHSYPHTNTLQPVGIEPELPCLRSTESASS